ncbi:hypothetical protein [Egbenema bharatensis]|uniref:hypothetical protein n=1 Tax=Egbenema bharatensis TaxID=3463334 RepID=UPI003A8A7247
MPVRSNHLSSRRSALKLARQGNARSIATLMNYSLKIRGITARANFQEGCLWVTLEGNPVPRQKDMVRFVYGGISRLNIPELKIVRVYGMRIGQTTPVWSQDIRLDQPYDDEIEESDAGIPPLRVSGSAQSLKQIYSKLNSDTETLLDFASDLSDPSVAVSRSGQRFADAPLSELLGEGGGVKRDRSMPAHGIETVTQGQRLRLSFPLTEPVPSQRRLMALLKVLTAITILVAVGSLWQVMAPLKGLPGMDDPLMLRVVGSAALLSMAIVAWFALSYRRGTNLHPKYAQQSYVRLGFAFLVNIGSALLLMLLFGLGILAPSSSVILPLFALCVGFWMMGCYSLAKAKGYHPLWGLAGILLLDGAVLLSIFPDRRLPHLRVVPESSIEQPAFDRAESNRAESNRAESEEIDQFAQIICIDNLHK